MVDRRIPSRKGFLAPGSYLDMKGDHVYSSYTFTSSRMGVIADTVGGGLKLRLLSYVFERLPIVVLSDAISGLPTSEGNGYLGARDLEILLELVCEDGTDRLNNLHNLAFNDYASAYSWESRSKVFVETLQGRNDYLM